MAPLVAPLFPEPGTARRFLNDLPISIIAALAAAGVVAPEQRLALGPEIVAAALVIGVTAWRRNLLLGVIAGVVTVALARALITG